MRNKTSLSNKGVRAAQEGCRVRIRGTREESCKFASAKVLWKLSNRVACAVCAVSTLASLLIYSMRVRTMSEKSTPCFRSWYVIFSSPSLPLSLLSLSLSLALALSLLSSLFSLLSSLFSLLSSLFSLLSSLFSSLLSSLFSLLFSLLFSSLLFFALSSLPRYPFANNLPSIGGCAVTLGGIYTCYRSCAILLKI